MDATFWDTFWKIVTYPIGIILFFVIGYGDVIREKITKIKNQLKNNEK